jgi:hypothetical protein
MSETWICTAFSLPRQPYLQSCHEDAARAFAFLSNQERWDHVGGYKDTCQMQYNYRNPNSLSDGLMLPCGLPSSPVDVDPTLLPNNLMGPMVNDDL